MSITLFPKLHRLLECKNAQVVAGVTHNGLTVVVDLSVFPLSACLSSCRFSVILIDPPWYEYYARAGGFASEPWWSVDQILSLDVPSIAEHQSFCFLWAGNRHVEQATACLSHWGFRRIESICWIKSCCDDYLPFGSSNFLHTRKEHLLVGIRGTVSRSVDHHLIHANIDNDIVMTSSPLRGTEKPEEIYQIIERFCNSKSRVELFAARKRPGWVSVGNDLQGPSTFELAEYLENHTGFTKSNLEIEQLRPKSPKKRNK